jgi:hypothetical protein
MDLTGGREQIDPAPINYQRVFRIAIRAIEIVLVDSEDYEKGTARTLFFSLSNDERILFQEILKAASPAGTRKTYYSCFKDHMRLENETI